MSEELKVITLVYDFAKYLLPVIGRFPRSERYQLGERIEGLTFDLLDDLLTAKYTRQKRDILFRANLRLEKIRFFVRLAYDLGFIGPGRFGHIADVVNRIGSQVGGWQKSAA